MKYIDEASAINLFKNAKTLKLNDKGFGTLDMVFDKAEKAKDDLNTFKRRVELVFGLKDKKEINRFIKKNVNWPELTEFLENINLNQQERKKMKTYKEYIKEVRDVSNLPDAGDIDIEDKRTAKLFGSIGAVRGPFPSNWTVGDVVNDHEVFVNQFKSVNGIKPRWDVSFVDMIAYQKSLDKEFRDQLQADKLEPKLLLKKLKQIKGPKKLGKIRVKEDEDIEIALDIDGEISLSESPEAMAKMKKEFFLGVYPAITANKTKVAVVLTTPGAASMTVVPDVITVWIDQEFWKRFKNASKKWTTIVRAAKKHAAGMRDIDESVNEGTPGSGLEKVTGGKKLPESLKKAIKKFGFSWTVGGARNEMLWTFPGRILNKHKAEFWKEIEKGGFKPKKGKYILPSGDRGNEIIVSFITKKSAGKIKDYLSVINKKEQDFKESFVIENMDKAVALVTTNVMRKGKGLGSSIKQSAKKNKVDIKELGLKMRKVFDFLTDSEWKESLKEDAPISSAGSGNIAGIGVGPYGEPGVKKKKKKKVFPKDKNIRRLVGTEKIDEAKIDGKAPNEKPLEIFERLKSNTFAGSTIFDVDTATLILCKNGRNKYERWNRFVDSGTEIGKQIKEFSQKNPTAGVILRDQTGAMMYLRQKSGSAEIN